MTHCGRFLCSISCGGLRAACLCLPFILAAHDSLAQTSQNPIQAMKDAWKKAKEQQRQQQNGPQAGRAPQDSPGSPSKHDATSEAGRRILRSTAKIDPELMAPSETGMQFGISDPGAHAIAAAHRGSRRVLLYDGAEGPKFDEIVPVGAGPAVFSPDGTRYAYTGRSGNERVIIVDGKEIFRFLVMSCKQCT